MDFSNIPKSKSNVLAGVAAGIAQYQNIDPIVVRALFVFAVFLTGGIALIAYTVLALLMPPPRED